MNRRQPRFRQRQGGGGGVMQRPELSVGIKPRTVGKGVVEPARRARRPALHGDGDGRDGRAQGPAGAAAAAAAAARGAGGGGRGRSVRLARVSISQGGRGAVLGGRPAAEPRLSRRRRACRVEEASCTRRSYGRAAAQPFAARRARDVEGERPLVTAPAVNVAAERPAPARGGARASFVNLPPPRAATSARSRRRATISTRSSSSARRGRTPCRAPTARAVACRRRGGAPAQPAREPQGARDAVVVRDGLSSKDRVDVLAAVRHVVAIWRDTNRLTTTDHRDVLRVAGADPDAARRLLGGPARREPAAVDAVLPRARAADPARLRRGLRRVGRAAARHLPLHPLAEGRALGRAARGGGLQEGGVGQPARRADARRPREADAPLPRVRGAPARAAARADRRHGRAGHDDGPRVSDRLVGADGRPLALKGLH